MGDIAIKVENLGKKYLIRHENQEPYKTFRETLINETKRVVSFLNPFKKSSRKQDSVFEEFWALKDINFEIKKGDRVGIIGRNGAGKSTLLKVLSRITEPTTGKIYINGRLSSLLEVGTGFHPELTGRENIFLNGAILGMSREEIKKKFDEIVAFAEIEKFLDTPVKRYSSGMYVRLAFSVAAHLEPEILLVDEVLAVGDIEFQKKCLGKMDEVSKKDGRTILFVSHNMSAIQKLCNRGILLEAGNLLLFSNILSTVEKYYNTQQAKIKTTFTEGQLNKFRKYPILHRPIEFKRIKMNKEVFEVGEEVNIYFDLLIHKNINKFRFSFTIKSASGFPIGSGFTNEIRVDLQKEYNKEFKVSIKDLNLIPGLYYISMVLGRGSFKDSHIDYDILINALQFKVEWTKKYDFIPQWPTNYWGNIIFKNAKLE